MGAPRLLLLFGVCASNAVSAEPPKGCELWAKGGGFATVEASSNPNGERVIAADIDGDGVNDRISWFGPGSGSIIPADNSTVTLTLSSSGKSFTLEEQRLHIVKYESQYFVFSSRIESERGPIYRDVYALTKAGFAKVCSFSIGIRG